MNKKLKIKSVTYSKLLNLGNYENERIEITVEVNPNSDGLQELKEAKKWVKNQLNPVKKEKYISRSNGHGLVCVCDICM